MSNLKQTTSILASRIYDDISGICQSIAQNEFLIMSSQNGDNYYDHKPIVDMNEINGSCKFSIKIDGPFQLSQQFMDVYKDNIRIRIVQRMNSLVRQSALDNMSDLKKQFKTNVFQQINPEAM